MSKILVTGALGQIGAELVPELRERHGTDNVIASGWRRRDVATVVDGGPFEIVDCTKPGDIAAVVEKHEIGTIYHMPAFLSVLGEERPEDAWALNLGGYANALEVARRHGCKVFFPSSIGAFGPGTPLQNTPQDTIQRPNTIYGVSKVAGELLGDYYHARFGLDTRGPQAARADLARGAAGRRHHRLRGPHLLRGAQRGALYLLPALGIPALI